MNPIYGRDSLLKYSKNFFYFRDEETINPLSKDPQTVLSCMKKKGERESEREGGKKR
jgi:hypothetical protein